MGDDGFGSGVKNLRKAFCYMEHETALIAFPAMRDGCHIGGVRLEEKG